MAQRRAFGKDPWLKDSRRGVPALAGELEITLRLVHAVSYHKVREPGSAI